MCLYLHTRQNTWPSSMNIYNLSLVNQSSHHAFCVNSGVWNVMRQRSVCHKWTSWPAKGSIGETCGRARRVICPESRSVNKRTCQGENTITVWTHFNLNVTHLNKMSHVSEIFNIELLERVPCSLSCHMVYHVKQCVNYKWNYMHL